MSTSPRYSVTFTGCGCQSVVGVQTASANNNDVEGWHARLNGRANNGRLNMYQLLYLLNEEAVLVNIGVHLMSNAGTSLYHMGMPNSPSGRIPQQTYNGIDFQRPHLCTLPVISADNIRNNVWILHVRSSNIRRSAHRWHLPYCKFVSRYVSSREYLYCKRRRRKRR